MELAVVHITGTLVGAAVGELWKAVMDAQDKALNFKPIFKRLESTLQLMVPRVNRLIGLNQKLNLPEDQLKDFITILEEGEQLVRKCLKISSLNVVRKVQYSKQLVELNTSLVSYLQTILVLDQAGDTKEILLLVKKFCTSVEGDLDEEIFSQTASSCIETDMLVRGHRDEYIDYHGPFSDPAELSSNDGSIVPEDEANQMNQRLAELQFQDSKKNRRNKEPNQMGNYGRTENLHKRNEMPGASRFNDSSMVASSSSIYEGLGSTIREESAPHPTPVIQRPESLDEEIRHYGIALYDFLAGGVDELNLAAGEEVEIEYEVDDWYHVKRKRPGRDQKMAGLVPVSFVGLS